MKRLLKVSGLLLAMCLVLGLITLRSVGFEPGDRSPGLWITGELVTTPVTDWSFADPFETIYVETRTPYWIPHSVITYCATRNGRLYLFSIYYQGGDFPEGRFWNRNVARDPRVRLKIGNRLFEGRAFVVADPVEKEAALQTFAKKYPSVKELLDRPESERPAFHFFRVEPR